MSEHLIPTAASKWTKDALDALNAYYDRHDVYEFVFDDRSMPNGLKERIKRTPFSYSIPNVSAKESKF